ncbi:MAG: class I SAM-dependent methyltransferase [Proteobacteria bacterium]|nr:class I SAM-dependent methyltransferase [Pseudomonadota bacterium]
MDLRELPGTSTRRHPWELARFGFFRDILDPTLRSAGTILDAGAGDAWFAASLLEHCAPRSAGSTRPTGMARTVVCWDSSYDPASRARLAVDDPRIELTRERPRGRFDLILALDVLEHVADDVGFLDQLVGENLEPHGRILINVPAWQALMSRHDEQLQHHRRYQPGQLTRVIEAAGLVVEQRGGLFHSLLMPRIVSVLRERLVSNPDNGQSAAGYTPLAWKRGRLAATLLYSALRVDNAISHAAAARSVQLPGLSAWALCHR